MAPAATSTRRNVAMKPRTARFLAVGVSLCLCLAVCLRAMVPAAAWAIGSGSSRRAVVAAALLGGAGLAADSASAASKPGQVRPPGENEDVDYLAGQDSEEIKEGRAKARIDEEKRQVVIKEKFRNIFAEFAGDGTTPARRAELLQEQIAFVNAEGNLPLGITRDDIVKGVRAVKFNIGCVKDKVKKDPDCKPIEKGYFKLLNAIDKANEKSNIR